MNYSFLDDLENIGTVQEEFNANITNAPEEGMVYIFVLKLDK